MNYFKGILGRSSFFSKILIFIAIFCFFLLMVVPIGSLMLAGNPTDIGLMKISQLILSVGLFVLPPFAFAYLNSKQPGKYLSLGKIVDWKPYAAMIVFMIVSIPFINLLTHLNQQISLPASLNWLETWMKDSESKVALQTEQFLAVNTISGFVFNLFVIALVPAFGEELFFRGSMLSLIREKAGVQTSIWLVAMIFSAIHFQFYGFVPRMLMGAFFGYILIWSNNIWLPILAHFTNNAFAVLFYYLENKGYALPDVDTTGTGTTLWIGIASGVIVVLGVLAFRKQLKTTNAEA